MTSSASMPVGEIIVRQGVSWRHLGDGVFEPVAGDLLMKRFDVNEGETLHRIPVDASPA